MSTFSTILSFILFTFVPPTLAGIILIPTPSSDSDSHSNRWRIINIVIYILIVLGVAICLYGVINMLKRRRQRQGQRVARMATGGRARPPAYGRDFGDVYLPPYSYQPVNGDEQVKRDASINTAVSHPKPAHVASNVA